jgi:voltage-gated potassium channel
MPFNLKRMVEENDTRAGRAFDLTIQVLIVLSLIAFSIGTLPNLSSTTERWLFRFEFVCVLIFTAEYLLRLWVAESRSAFVFSFFGIIDLLAILPFYIALGVDLRSIRIFRFLRLFRAFKLVRYSKAISRFHRAFSIAREELILFLIVTLMLLYFAAVGIYFFENEAQPDKFASVFDCLWWSVATLTTVGYGDVYPITVGGKIFTFVVLLLGLGFVSVPAGLVASALSKARAMEDSVDESKQQSAVGRAK